MVGPALPVFLVSVDLPTRVQSAQFLFAARATPAGPPDTPAHTTKRAPTSSLVRHRAPVVSRCRHSSPPGHSGAHLTLAPAQPQLTSEEQSPNRHRNTQTDTDTRPTPHWKRSSEPPASSDLIRTIVASSHIRATSSQHTHPREHVRFPNFLFSLDPATRPTRRACSRSAPLPARCRVRLPTMSTSRRRLPPPAEMTTPTPT